MLEKSVAYRDRMVRETVRCVTFVNSALLCQTLYKTYGPMRQLSKTFGGKIVDPVWDLSLYSLVLVCIFSILFSLPFLWYQEGDLVEQSRASTVEIIFLLLMTLMNDVELVL